MLGRVDEKMQVPEFCCPFRSHGASGSILCRLYDLVQEMRVQSQWIEDLGQPSVDRILCAGADRQLELPKHLPVCIRNVVGWVGVIHGVHRNKEDL